MTLEEIARALGARIRPGQKSVTVCCPNHKDKTPSLSLRERDGKILVTCFGGCGRMAVIQKLREMGLWSGRPKLSREDWVKCEQLRRVVAELDRVKEALVEAPDAEQWAQACRAQYAAAMKLKEFGVAPYPAKAEDQNIVKFAEFVRQHRGKELERWLG